ncbi:MAG: glycosyltransferase N-terminal domain-containing protein [Pseudomonadota bacterium]
MKNIRHRASLEAYRLAGQAALPLQRARYAQLVRDGLEDADRVQEHFGYPSQPREDGSWVWFHAGSADEARSMLPLVRLCAMQGLRIVATAASRYGLSFWEREAQNRGTLVAQYAPTDVERCVNRFLDYWQPDLAITVADHIWPVTTHCLSAKRISNVVVGGVLSQRSHDFWAVRRSLAARTFGQLDMVAAIDTAQADIFREFGALEVEVCGDLAFDAPVDAINPHADQGFWRAAGIDEGRKAWLATPTSLEELTLCIEAQRALVLAGSDAVCLLAPPPSLRMISITKAVADAGLVMAEAPPSETKSVSDEGWAASANIVLMPFGAEGERAAIRSDAIYLGGSFGSGHSGGLSPVPAIHHRLAIVSGDGVQRHLALFSRLHKSGAVQIIKSGDELAAVLLTVLGDELAHRRMTDAALTTLWPVQGAVNNTYIALDRYLRPMVYKARMDVVVPLAQPAE